MDEKKKYGALHVAVSNILQSWFDVMSVPNLDIAEKVWRRIAKESFELAEKVWDDRRAHPEKYAPRPDAATDPLEPEPEPEH